MLPDNLNGAYPAGDFYQAMFGLLADQLGGRLSTCAAVGIIWPSLLFPDDDPATAHPVPSTGAQGVGNPFAGLWSGGREVLRTLSYYAMKNRAGVVGQQGLGSAACRAGRPRGLPRIHLMGRSFGARLVSYSLGGSPTSRSPGKPYGFLSGTYYEMDANAVVGSNQSPFSGAHSDIRPPRCSGRSSPRRGSPDGTLIEMHRHVFCCGLDSRPVRPIRDKKDE